MSKKILSLILALALMLTCFSGVALISTAEELPGPYGSVDFGGADGAIRINGTGGMCVRVINTSETETNITAGTAIGDTGLYGYAVDTANYGLYVGGKILNEIPDNTDVVYAVEYYIDSETPLLNTTLKVNGGADTVSEFANLPVGKGVALYHLPAAKVDEIQANQYGGDTRVRIYIVGEGVGKLYVTGLKILDARYAATPVNPGYAYYDAGTVGACSYYPDLPAASVNQMYEQDAEITATFAGYRYYKFAAEAAAHSSSATENKPVYIKVYTNASNQNATVAINTYQIYGEKNDGSGTAATHSALIKDAKNYSITVQNGVGGVYLPATCFRNGAGIGSFRLDMANAQKVTRIEVYDVATYCNEANATVEMKAELHKGMLTNGQNLTEEGNDILCATCGEILKTKTVYAKLDFASGTLVGTAATASDFTVAQIPGTEYYGAKMNKQNQTLTFSLESSALAIDEEDILAGTDLAITYEYYATSAWDTSSRLTLVGNGYNLGINGGGVSNVWDCLPVNVGSALTKDALGTVTFTVGAGSEYVAEYNGNIGNGTTAVAGTAYETLSQAQALVNGKTFTFYCWNNDTAGTSGKELYLKSITVCAADELAEPDVAENSDYLVFDHVGNPVYYPQYTCKVANNITMNTDLAIEYFDTDTNKEYGRFNYGYVILGSNSANKTSGGVAKSVEIRVTRKANSAMELVEFQYQVGEGATWSGMKALTFGDSDTVSIVATDAVLQNQLNGGSSIRIRDTHYERFGDAENGYTYAIKETDNLSDIAKIEVLPYVETCAHENATTVTVDATCTTAGSVTVTCDDCGEVVSTETIEALGHTEVIDEAKAPTCTATGLTEGKHCDVCGEVLVAQTVVDALGHTPITDDGKAPSCTDTGLTAGAHCDVCGEVLTAQDVIDALGHEEVIDEAKAPTCTETGLTEGSHCDVCGEVLVAQEIVDALGHEEVIDEAKAPTCTETGLTEGSHCDVCGEVLVAQEIVDALGHDEGVLEGAFDATVAAPGYTGDLVCGVCGEMLKEGEIIPALEAKIENGVYYVDGERAYYAGLVAFEGEIYYVSDGARVVKGRYFISNTNGIEGFSKGYYYFDENGALVTENGVYDGFYYEGGRAATYAGAVEYDGNVYYVQVNGALQTGRYAISKGNGILANGFYFFDENGAVKKNVVEGGFYYGADGRCVAYRGIVEVDGAFYYVNNNGAVVKNNAQFYVTKTNGLVTRGLHAFDAEGKMI